jgi:hypothetical protein
MGKGIVVIILDQFLSALLRPQKGRKKLVQNEDDNTFAHL